MKKNLIFPISLWLFATFFVARVQAESIVPDGVEHADSFGVVMDINSDATVSVTETIAYNFGDNTKPGITRYIPLSYKDLSGATISASVSDLSVVDENSNAYVFNQSSFSDEDKSKTYLKIDIGDPAQSQMGTKTYVLHYVLSGAIKFLSDHDEIFWDMAGDKWPVYVKYPEIKINFPQKVTSDSISKQCYVGLHQATVACIDRDNKTKEANIDYSYKGIVSSEGMTTIVDFPKGIAQKKTQPQQSVLSSLQRNGTTQLRFLLGVLAFIVVIVLVKINFKKISSFFSKENLLKAYYFANRNLKKHLPHVHHHAKKIKNKSRKWWISAFVVLAVVFALGFVAFLKVDIVLNKISTKGESVGSLVQAGLDTQHEVKGEGEDRINILLLGILGENHPGGGMNTDTIMVASIEPKANKISLVSIPRDLWVTDPGKDTKSKINAVYLYGEEKATGQGMVDVESKISEITGLPIHYVAIFSTQGFSQLVDTLGGVDVDLPKPFDESSQFVDVKVCDDGAYTIPTGEFEVKKNKKKKVVAEYPLCKNSNPECGGDFHLPAGKNTLTGSQALCFVRSRYLTSDFERAKRQQLILQQLKQKVSQVGFLDFGKMNSILDNMGDNARTNMQLWEMRRIFDLYKGMDNPKIFQRVLEDSKEGLLYSPDATPETGYILLPRGDNYDAIQDLFKNIFTTQAQSDIKPRI